VATVGTPCAAACARAARALPLLHCHGGRDAPISVTVSRGAPRAAARALCLNACRDCHASASSLMLLRLVADIRALAAGAQHCPTRPDSQHRQRLQKGRTPCLQP